MSPTPTAIVLLLLLLAPLVHTTPTKTVCPRCRPPTVCAGSAHKKLCVHPLPEGSTCLKSHFSVCEKGLICAGPPTEKRCVRPLTRSKPCKGDPYAVCASRFQCRDGVCKRPAVGKGGKCSLPNGLECKDGFICARPPSNKRCVVPMPLGKACNKDPYWVCEDGLQCRNQICKEPRVPERGSCRKQGAECEKGLVCAGPQENKRCVVPMPLGKPCEKDPYWVCVSGLECRDRVCKKPRVPERGPCKEKDAECQEGLVCAGTSINKRCVVPMPEGKPCRRDPYWVCEKDLACVDEICSK